MSLSISLSFQYKGILKVHSHQMKAEAKAKSFFEVSCLFFDLFLFRSYFRLVWIALYAWDIEA